MPMLNLREASPDEMEARLKELREEFIDMSEGRRAEVDDAGLRSMIREVDTLDTLLHMSRALEAREQAKLAATAGALTDAGFRTIGEAVIDGDLLAKIGKSLPGGWTDHIREDGTRSERQHVASMEFDGQLGKEVSNWLRLAGMFSPAEGVRAVTEWGGSGPGTGTSFDSTASGSLLPRLGQPIPPTPRQARLFLRDLIPSMTTTLPNMPYVRELNPVTYESSASGGATTVAEGSTKPTATLSFVAANSPIATIASTLTLSKQMFEDAPAVVQYINQRLPYLVKFREDQQILNGSGTWPDVMGLTNTSGILSQSGTAGDPAVTIGNAMAKVENQDGAANAVVMNPTDAWTMFLRRASTSGVLDAGSPFAALPLTVWGVPTYRSRAYAAGTALVSDFERGAMIVDRQQVNVQTYNERYAEQNLVLLICEERLGLMVFRPDLFCQATIN